MADIAQLGFDIDTAPLVQTNAQLTTMVASAGAAERAVVSMTTAATSGFTSMGAAVSATQSAMAQVAATARTTAQTATQGAQQQTQAVNAAAAAVNNLGAAHTTTGAAATRSTGSMVTGYTMAGAAAGAAAAVAQKLFEIISDGVSKVKESIDAWIQLKNTLVLTGIAGNDVSIVTDKLFKTANDSGQPIDALVTLYRRLNLAGGDLGASQTQLLQLSEGVSAALRIQGTSTTSARGALLQLSQSFGTGVVHAQEFNSIIENAYPIALAAAKGMKGMDGSVGALRTAIIAGNITSKQFFDAILKGTPELIKMADSMQLTLGAAANVASNSFIELVGRIDDATGVSKGLVSAIQEVSHWMEDLSKNQNALDWIAHIFALISEQIRLAIKDMKQFAADLKAIGAGAVDVMTKIGGAIAGAKSDEAIDAAKKIASDAQDQLKGAQMRLESMEGSRQTGAMQKNIAEQKALIEGLTKTYNDATTAAAALQRKETQRAGAQGVTNSPYDSDAVEVYGPFTSALNDPISGTPGAGKAAKHKPLDPYTKIIQGAKDYIALKQVETSVVGLGVAAAAEEVHFQELVNKAKMANLPVTKTMIDQYRDLAKQEAAADAAFKSAKEMKTFTDSVTDQVAAQKIQLDVLGMSTEAARAYTIAQTELNKRKKEGLDSSPEQVAAIQAGADAIAAAEAKTKSYTDAVAFTKDIFHSFAQDMANALISGKNLWESFGAAALSVLSKIADKLINMAIDDLFSNAFGGNSAKSNNGGLSGFVSSLGRMFGGGDTSSGTASSSNGGGGILSSIGSGLGGMFRQTSDFFGLTTPSPITAADIGIGSGPVSGVSNGIFGSGISGLGALGAVGGLASGAMQLFGGKGGTASTIGGIGSMIGAGVSLIPGIGQIAGPAISILSSLLPSLFGGTPQPINSYGTGGLDFQGGAFNTSGSTYGPNGQGTTGALGSAGSSIQAVFDSLGGVKDSSKVYGARLASFNQQYADGSSFQNQTSSLVSPTGQVSQWGQGSTDKDVGLGTLSGQIAVKSILEGAVGAITDNMRKALGNLATPDISVVAQTVADIKAFDDALSSLNKTTNPMIDALAKIDDQFKALYATANQYGLDTGQVDSAKLVAQQKLGTDFAKTITDQLMDPLTKSLQDIGDQRTTLQQQNSALMGIAGYQDQAANIDLLYLKQRNAIMDQYNAAAIAAAQAAADNLKQIVSGLDDYLKTLLPGGALAGESATAHLAGLSATYDQARVAAQANPLDKDTVDAFIKAGNDFATYSKDYYGNNKDYISTRDQLVADAQALQAQAGGQPTTAAGSTTSGMASTQTQFTTLLATISTLTDQLTAQSLQTAALQARVDRLLANGGR